MVVFKQISRFGRTLRLLGTMLGMVLLVGHARPAMAQAISDSEIQNRRCLSCHAETSTGQQSFEKRMAMVSADGRPATGPAARPEIHVTREQLEASVHGNVACVSCHPDANSLPHKAVLAPPRCDTAPGCHAKQAGQYLQGKHSEKAATGDKNAPTCVTCHGGHDILPKTDRASRTFPLNVVKTCGGCHEKHMGSTPNGSDAGGQVSKYLESVHGQAVTKAGLTVAATCADCHGEHDVHPSSDKASPVNRVNVPQTCGKCHVGVVEAYAKSIHGQLPKEGENRAPVCSDCHTAHQITRTDSPAFMRDIVSECGSCHDKPKPGSHEKASLYETYRASFHGQVTQLSNGAETRAARCSDCHGAHTIRRVDDPESPVNAANKVQTCKGVVAGRPCHVEASASFASFAPHADFRNSDRYPILHYVYLYFVVMMSASFGFFGLHCVLWFARSVIERIRNGPAAVRPKIDHAKGAIQRFNRVDRINHGLVIITFFGLALTGLPLFYSDKEWSHVVAAIFGGAQTCRIVHRIFAVMLIGNFVVHGVGVARRFKKMGLKQMLFGPTTMLPRKKDFQDLLGMAKWFFVGGSKPKFDRWTYWEKFDYTAEVGGSVIIGISGLLLWFPVFFSNYLPGWMFNVASIVHGFEALLAVGFIFTIHFFNAHLRMEKFPVDDVMFTGRLPEEEFKHERAAEYERLAASGELAGLRVAAAPAWYRHFAVFMGISAMTVGTIIIALIIMAALRII